mmetsp:Transcript_3409/g.8053  ORF Transcript_3409/g.8053 Transcript_3409/m.8053 type:complete len:286 (+) Transcript_3409:100-957(+)
MSLSAPTRLMDSRLKPTSDLTTFLLRCHDARGCAGVCVRSVVLLGTLGSVVYSALDLVYCLHNVHVRFWLGDIIIVCLAVHLAALVPAVVMLTYKICVTSHRRGLKELSKTTHGSSSTQEDYSCRMSAKTLRFIFVLLTLLSSLAAVLGYLVVTNSTNTSAALLAECGDSGNSAALAKRDAMLADFRSSSGCQESSLDACPGFAKAFPPPAPFASYIKVLEFELDCGGWCSYHRPFFNPAASTEACSIHLSRHLWAVATFTGAPVMVSAALLAMVGFLLYSYDGL